MANIHLRSKMYAINYEYGFMFWVVFALQMHIIRYSCGFSRAWNDRLKMWQKCEKNVNNRNTWNNIELVTCVQCQRCRKIQEQSKKRIKNKKTKNYTKTQISKQNVRMMHNSLLIRFFTTFQHTFAFCI